MDSNGNEKPIYNLSQGEICIFSINCIFTKVVYPAWVTIDSPEAKILSIQTSTFKYLYENESAVKEFVFNSMSQRIFDLMSSIEEITLYDVDYRINSFLVRSCPENQILQLSHQDIASTLGTAREVVSRHLKELEKKGYIELSRMNIKIILPEALAKISPK
jgi:CRP/FNR family transcriptional regulator